MFDSVHSVDLVVIDHRVDNGIWAVSRSDSHGSDVKSACMVKYKLMLDGNDLEFGEHLHVSSKDVI